MPRLIVILGSTGIGKTKVSLFLAEVFNTNIISCDARQFFREIRVGTSSPKRIILDNIEHNFIGHLTIWDSYNARDYQKDAFKKLNELFTRLPIVLMVGGSGLYCKVIIYGINYLPFFSKEISRDLRIKISLQEKLKKMDHRYLRSLEIIRYSNRSFSSIYKEITIYYYYHIFRFGLNLPRNVLYDSINKRVEYMIKCGLLEEAQECYSLRYLNALKTIGYKDIFNYFDGKISFEKAIKEIKKNTRRYAKRQITWFKKEKKMQWFIANKENNILQNVKKKLAYL